MKAFNSTRNYAGLCCVVATYSHYFSPHARRNQLWLGAWT